jgi:hypothetical protein
MPLSSHRRTRPLAAASVIAALAVLATPALAAIPPHGTKEYVGQVDQADHLKASGPLSFDTYNYSGRVGINGFSDSLEGPCTHSFIERVASPQAGGSAAQAKIHSNGTFSFRLHDTRLRSWRLVVSGRFTTPSKVTGAMSIKHVASSGHVICSSGTFHFALTKHDF